jgi:DNA replication licensing factor MCM7
MTIHVKGELTKICSPGDIITVAGIFLPTPYTSAKTKAAGLLADTYLEAMSIQKFKKSYSSYVLTPELQEKVNQLAEGVYRCVNVNKAF